MIYTERWCRGLRRLAAAEETVTGTLKSWDPATSGEGYDLLLDAKGLDLLIRWVPQDPNEERKVLGAKGQVLTFKGTVVGESETYRAVQNAVHVPSDSIEPGAFPSV